MKPKPTQPIVILNKRAVSEDRRLERVSSDLSTLDNALANLAKAILEAQHILRNFKTIR